MSLLIFHKTKTLVLEWNLCWKSFCNLLCTDDFTGWASDQRLSTFLAFFLWWDASNLAQRIVSRYASPPVLCASLPCMAFSPFITLTNYAKHFICIFSFNLHNFLITLKLHSRGTMRKWSHTVIHYSTLGHMTSATVRRYILWSVPGR